MNTDSDMPSSTLTFSVRHCRHPVLHQLHPTTLDRATRDRLQYHSRGAALADAEASMTGRERKSINYAEPKLNTLRTTSIPLSHYLTYSQQKDAQTRSSAPRRML